MTVDPNLKKNVTRRNTWLRGLYMLLFALIYSLAEVVVIAVAILQFLVVLVTASPNTRLLEFGRGLSCYIYQIWLFLTFNDERLPFPFDRWPDPLQQQGTDRHIEPGERP
ncbi:MAG: DUF4389 domain-containing protein [Candidatus Competibacteraceae bacterium]|nr:DUF4389 domain-containing protein [Candidatus Competibacteraceae bacterium]